jgi:hypothetical protein
LSLRDGPKAVKLASHVAQAQQTPQHLETLAQALAEAGRCDEAAKIQEQLLALAESLQREDLITRLKAELARYQAGAPCRPSSEAATFDSEPAPQPQESETTNPKPTNSEPNNPEPTDPESQDQTDTPPATAEDEEVE